MGQYHYVVNLDKKQFLHPHRFGDGLKLMEFGQSGGGTMTALAILLGVSSREGGRGGGDFRLDREGIVGSWGGDRIAIVGDYAEADDLAPEFQAEDIYGRCGSGEFTDISAVVLALMEEAGEARPMSERPFGL